MTGTECIRRAAMKLRDWSDDGKTPHVKYPKQEKLDYLKEALESIATELASMDSALVEITLLNTDSEWNATITPGSSAVVLPSNFMNHNAVYVVGYEDTDGPLNLVSRENRFASDGRPKGVYFESSYLNLVPAPVSSITLRMCFNAWPTIVRLDAPSTDSEADTQLAYSLPWRGLFDAAIVQFVTAMCGNRNEYDVNVELALHKMLAARAQEVASRDSYAARSHGAVGSLWNGSE